MKIKLKKLIEKLQRLEEKYGDIDVVTDHDAADGYYELVKVQMVNVEIKFDEHLLAVNLQTSRDN